MLTAFIFSAYAGPKAPEIPGPAVMEGKIDRIQRAKTPAESQLSVQDAKNGINLVENALKEAKKELEVKSQMTLDLGNQVAELQKQAKDSEKLSQKQIDSLTKQIAKAVKDLQKLTALLQKATGANPMLPDIAKGVAAISQDLSQS